ncbi:MAG: hypothetical protein JWL63_1847 [Rhodocyclales bacterium]|nr:hypothetical protein [Rhodocyclales bacterium]
MAKIRIRYFIHGQPGRLPIPLLLVCLPISALALTTDITDLSLEQLGNIVVTSVSRREEPLIDAAASIFVISADDIRRSGATTLPEALRLAPTLQVARADANQYAISARGFNNVLANKMLVLIDGRTVYTPLFSGVFWDAQQAVMDDIERIEVISGPGATLWGANAVNGVINVITRKASDTQGSLLSLTGGERESGETVRYGGRSGESGYFRAYARHFERDASRLSNGTPNHDSARGQQGGFRADFKQARDTLTVQGDAYESEAERSPSGVQLSGANLLARWNRTLRGGSELRLQTFYDHTKREQPGFTERLDTLDVELQHTFMPFSDNEAIWGAGYRTAHDQVLNSAAQAFLPSNVRQRWSNVFIQDTLKLSPKVDLTAGLKVESNPYTGAEYLPNLRLRWLPSADTVVWGALSRSVRAPSRIDRDLYLPGNPPYLLSGNTDFQSEVARVVELGYRSQLLPSWSYSITLFHADYDRLRSIEPKAGGGLVFDNKIAGTNTGVELWSNYRVTDWWRLVGGFVAQRQRLKPKDGSNDQGGIATLGNDPDAWWSLRSSFDIGAHYTADVAVRRVGALPNPAVPGYTATDLRVAWRPQRGFELSLGVENLFDSGHVEWGPSTATVEYGRTTSLRALWKL